MAQIYIKSLRYAKTSFYEVCSTLSPFLGIFSSFKKKISDDSNWMKKSKFVQLNTIDVSEDPVRPELDLEWRKSFGKKIFGLQAAGMTEHCCSLHSMVKEKRCR